ncbi:hypothetical protein Pfo_003371 [Paulownia fortunei]|nr:hypothetical protein Pfo_003371 [Paulownia fortunei]
MKRRTAKIAASTLSRAAAADANGGGNKKKAVKLDRRLVKYEELPEYLKDNEFITDYYRCEWPLKNVFLSVFSLHNETLNIWTHLVGFMIFLGLTVMSLTEKMTLENVVANLFGSLMALVYFLGGAMGCLIFSTISHLFACHSRRFYYFFWRLDYVGISLMIVCSFFAPIYYTFSDQPYWRFLYLSSITLVGILVVITLLAPALSGGRFRSFRATLFLCMGFSGVIPATHAVILHWAHPQIRGSLGYEIAMGLLYGAGAVFYVTRIPERWKPGAFDIVGHSHQIFHIFVVAAALAHSAATLIIMEWRRGLTA